jgi:hypothetical protein
MAIKTEQILVRVAPELRHEIELAAADERRSLSDTIRNVLRAWAVRRLAKRECEKAA